MQISSAVRRIFVPVTITLNTEVEVANLLGALIAYGTASVYAENGLKAVGLGDWYSGNVRKAARSISKEIAAAIGIEGLDDLLEVYLTSDKFTSSAPSKAGAKVIGTDADLAPGRESTNFEPTDTDTEVEPEDEESDEDAYSV